MAIQFIQLTKTTGTRLVLAVGALVSLEEHIERGKKHTEITTSLGQLFVVNESIDAIGSTIERGNK